MASSGQGYAHRSKINLTAERLRLEINTHFQLIIQSLRERETQLLARLDEMVSSYEASTSKLQFKMEELSELYKANKKNFELSELHQLQGSILKEIDKELKSTKKQLSNIPSPEFIWENKLFDQISSHGSIELTSKSNLDYISYADKLSALVSVCKKGCGIGELHDAWGLDINRESGDIYIADQLNNRVQVFDSECNFKFTFNSTELRQPMGITIYKEKVFVCQAKSEEILVFDLEGKLLNRFGEKILFNSIYFGIAVREGTGDIFVCNYNNNLIQIYDKNMELIKLLTGLEKPCYLQLTDTHIIVLDKDNPCLHWYDYDLKSVRSLITRGPELQVDNIAAFCVDSEGNIVMTDNYSIKVFSQQGELIHQITDNVIFPNGIRIDSKNRIVIVSYRKENNLQMF